MERHQHSRPAKRVVPLPTATLPGEKVQPWHRDRLAVVYIRQSTPQQVLDHQESTRLQYGLVARARDLGWAAERIVVIDDDLGKSGSSTTGRTGFQRLVSEVSLDHVGLILGIEISRLARSCKDWHQLLELCALFGTLITDSDGIYDPAQYKSERVHATASDGTRIPISLVYKKDLQRDGKRYDMYLYGLLHPEWEKVKTH